MGRYSNSAMPRLKNKELFFSQYSISDKGIINLFSRNFTSLMKLHFCAEVSRTRYLMLSDIKGGLWVQHQQLMPLAALMCILEDVTGYMRCKERWKSVQTSLPYFKSQECNLYRVSNEKAVISVWLPNKTHGSFNPIDHKVVIRNVSFDANMDICHLKNMLEHWYFRWKQV